ncbi:hypothetical protein GWI33_002932 [Rhynchophorus ferrugineus]|uniref:Uncharacterized protein n=1 Tax=Rhynchophorus ferrugineus TaxID=354439 RepID=A0A834INK3_RHYFE|nr:hypothetical protein GWI33_002932 [Rhynchophorus ferrugineus]
MGLISSSAHISLVNFPAMPATFFHLGCFAFKLESKLQYLPVVYRYADWHYIPMREITFTAADSKQLIKIESAPNKHKSTPDLHRSRPGCTYWRDDRKNEINAKYYSDFYD